MHRSTALVRVTLAAVVTAVTAVAVRATSADAAPSTLAVGALAARAVQDDTTLVGRTITADNALRGGLTSVPVGTAVTLINAIGRDLQASGNPALGSIAGDLEQLSAALGASEVDGARVGTLLSRVGRKVTAASGTQSGAVRSTLASLGGQLSGAGRQLGGSEPVRKAY